MNGYYGLEVRTGSAAAIEVIINGIPYRTEEAGETSVHTLAIHGEVVPGENRIDVLIGSTEIDPGDSDPVPVPPSPEMFVVVKLQQDIVTVTETDYETEVLEMAEASWRAEEIDPDALVLPARLSLNFTAPEDKIMPSWADATPVAVDDIEKTAIEALRTMRDLLAKGDVEGYAALMRIRYRDAAKAYPLGGDAAEIEKFDLLSLRQILSMPGFEMEEIDEGTVCRAFAEGRMVRCFAPDGKAPVRGDTPDRENPLFLQSSFSMIDGKLVVVR